MVWLVYLGVAVLIGWSVWYVCRTVLRRIRGRCDGDCAGCAFCDSCDPEKKRTPRA